MSLVLVGCGGATRDNPNGSGKLGGTGGSQAGSPASGGNGSAGGMTSVLAGVKLDDKFPWFVQAAGGEVGKAQQQGEGEDKLVHAVLGGSPVEATISTHNHVDVVGSASVVLFAAKATAHVTLLVSVRSSLSGSDYFAAEAAGQPWPAAAVDVGTDWQSYAVAFADMTPPAAPEPAQMPAFMIAFIVQHPTAPLELWFDDVHFE